MTPDQIRAMVIWRYPQRRDRMYNFVTEEQQYTTETLESLIDSIIELENVGNLNDEEADECIYYLQKIADITGASINFDDYYEPET